jgi:threonine dehydrogenase-like Zn-dependent dehydrogenase
MQAARLAGAAQIIAADLHQDKLDQAPAMGATDTILVTAEGQLAGAVMGITDGQGVDHAIICAGSVDALVQSYRATKVGGSVVLSGIPPMTAKEFRRFSSSTARVGCRFKSWSRGDTALTMSLGATKILQRVCVVAVWCALTEDITRLEDQTLAMVM